MIIQIDNHYTKPILTPSKMEMLTSKPASATEKNKVRLPVFAVTLAILPPSQLPLQHSLASSFNNIGASFCYFIDLNLASRSLSRPSPSPANS